MAKKSNLTPATSEAAAPKENTDAENALFLAIEQGDVDLVKNAFLAGASKDARDDLGNTPLCAAASAGQLGVVTFLVDQGADVTIEGYCDMTALTLAARDGHLDVVKYLLAHGAAFSERVVNDAIHVGSMSVAGKPEIIELLKEARLSIVAPAPRGMNDAGARMMRAAASGDAKEVEAAIQDGADVSAQDDRGMDALSWAALRGHDAAVRVLLDHGAGIDALNSSGWPPIGQACGQGWIDVVKTLIERGADINIIFDGGRTALMCAAHQGFPDVVRALLTAGADPSREYAGMTARDLAMQRGHGDIVKIFDSASKL